MNADHEEAVEFAKVSKRENRVYVGNLSYEVRYRDLMEFMRGGGWGIISFFFGFWFWFGWLGRRRGGKKTVGGWALAGDASHLAWSCHAAHAELECAGELPFFLSRGVDPKRAVEAVVEKQCAFFQVFSLLEIG
jgi:hypothetical protein